MVVVRRPRPICLTKAHGCGLPQLLVRCVRASCLLVDVHAVPHCEWSAMHEHHVGNKPRLPCGKCVGLRVLGGLGYFAPLLAMPSPPELPLRADLSRYAVSVLVVCGGGRALSPGHTWPLYHLHGEFDIGGAWPT